MKKKVIALSFLILASLLVFSSFSTAIFTLKHEKVVGADHELTDPKDDLDELKDLGLVSTSEEFPWMDIETLNFTEGDGNYTVQMKLLGDYNTSAKNVDFEIHLNINESDTEPWNSYFCVSIYTWDNLTQCKVRCDTSIDTYQLYYDNPESENIDGNVVSWTFPKENITKLVPNNKEISKWKVGAYSKARIMTGEATHTKYVDQVPNSSSDAPSDSNGGGIPGFPLLLVGLISVGSILAIAKKLKK